MRITDMLSQSTTISKRQYDRILQHGVKVIMCSKDGWDFTKQEATTEAEANKWIRQIRQQRDYEARHKLEPTTPVLIVRYIIDGKSEVDSPEPEWPAELKPYKGRTDNILEAYYCHRFNLPTTETV